MCQVTLIGIMVVLLYASRACYNLVVLALADIETINSFDYDWYNVSDQVCVAVDFELATGVVHIHAEFTGSSARFHSENSVSVKQKFLPPTSDL